MWLKICGITSADAVAAALAARVDAIGFVFSPSVRRLEPGQAAQLAAAARGRASLVAVTAHPEQQLVDEIVRVFQPDVLQTDLQDFDALRLPDTLSRLPVLRAGVGSGAALPHRLLFEGARSGSGEAADWNTASRLARMSELILAGGLSAHNVAAAIRAVRPYGVDVSSGVESAPGRKSAHMIAEFVEAARAAFQGMADDEH
ncbi:MAG TPA: phosphoribosylanthranilate isomerase [Steroidobacteraceae bacterium]|jgi:phosphoribosylanthranilate isomerase|nr:phosphoribosylanthranilate isomerase [Steroidobacteraceae bacterium]